MLKAQSPGLKINGHETDVVLIPSAQSRLGNRVNYLLGAYDQFNNLAPIQDPTNTTDGAARFSPQELATWAPSVATAKSNEAIKKAALNVVEQERRQDVAELEKKTPAWQVILGLASPADYLEHVATSDKSQDRLNQVIESLGGKVESRTAAEARNQITDADNVGVSAELINPGNIDLNNRPHVKNKDGSISTVRSITIEQDGTHYVIPTVSDEGTILSNPDAVKLFHKTGKHLGSFKSAKAADKFAQELHESEAAKLKGNE